MTLTRLYERLAAIDALIVSLEKYRRCSGNTAAPAVTPAYPSREGATWGGIVPVTMPLHARGARPPVRPATRAGVRRAASKRASGVHARRVVA